MAIKRRRRSTMSERAPEGIANKNIGSELATWTSDTISGSGSSPLISQPAAAFCIHVPMLETTVADHRTAKDAWRNGASDEVVAGAALAGWLGDPAVMA